MAPEQIDGRETDVRTDIFTQFGFLHTTGKRGGFRRIFSFSGWRWRSSQGGRNGRDSAGGSVRDNEVIAAADRLNLAMVFTGMRYFLHW